MALGKWKAEDFFQSPRARQICNAISSFDHVRLRQLVDSEGSDLQVRGRDAFTLLGWAYSEDNLRAFEILLEAGASPDVRIDGLVGAPHVKPFFNNDTILFTSLRSSRYDYFVTALRYSHSPDLRDSHGDSLLHIFFYPNEPSGYHKYGYTSDFLLQEIMLKSGVDPSLQDESGRTVSDLIEKGRSRLEKRFPEGGRNSDLRELEVWLDANAAADAVAANE